MPTEGGDRAQRDDRDDRDVRAFVLLVPIVALLWVLVTLVMFAAVDGLGAAVADVPSLVVGTLFVGVPIAAAVVVVAGALFALLEATVGTDRRVALVAGACLGALVGLGLARWLTTPWAFEVVRGVAVGLPAGAIWWRMRGGGSN